MQDDRSFEHILNEARFAARQAVDAKGPENMNALDCGFAWVTIGGNEPLARHCRKMLAKGPGVPLAVDTMFSEIGRELWLKENRQDESSRRRFYGSKAYPSGWQWWNPGDFAGQAIGHKEAGAMAFMRVLGNYNIRATVGSRLD